MKYLRLFESFEVINEVVMSESHIDEICKKYSIGEYTINPDGYIDVNDYVDLYNKGLTKLPLKFNKVNDNFWCSNNKLASLKGSPKEVNGSFYCNDNQLTTLEGSPVEVNGNFDCSINKLTTFEYAPKRIRGIFDCVLNNIKTFEYFPSYIKYLFYCKNNPIYEVWELFEDLNKIELLNDFDIFRDEDTDTPGIVMNRLNDFLLTIGREQVEKVDLYKNI